MLDGELTLLAWARRLQTVSSYGELLAVAMEQMRAGTRYRSAWLALFDDELTTVFVLAGIGDADLEKVKDAEMMSFSFDDDPMIAELLRSTGPVVVEDAPNDPRPRQDRVAAMGNRTIINIPLQLDERYVGTFGLGTFAPEGPMPPTPEELAHLSNMASHISVVIGRLRAEERRTEAEAQLQRAQRLEAMGRLAGGIAHDFNNLLTAVLGNVELAKLEPGLSKTLVGFLDDAEEATIRAATLSRQLLAFARGQVVEARPLDLNRQLENLVPMLRRMLPEPVAVELLSGNALGTVLADPGQVDQVVLNLVLNASDAMPDGGRIIIESENVLIDEEYRRNDPSVPAGRFVLLTVTDTGLGMSEAVRAQIFEPFFTTKDSDRGTGLGLPVVFGIVKQHRGHLHVYSEPGLGTTFKIYLPIVERSAVHVGTKLERPVHGGPEHVLVVDDDPRVRRVVHAILAHAGYRVTEAEDGDVALERHAEAAPPIDLVVSDMVMPNLGGKALYEALRERDPGVRVLLMSGYAANGLSTQLGETEGLAMLSKPFRTQTFLRKIRALLDD